MLGCVVLNRTQESYEEESAELCRGGILGVCAYPKSPMRAPGL